MNKIINIIRIHIGPDCHGQILVLVLIFLTLGILVIAPLLGYIGTGIKTGILFEKKTDMTYAADAGVEDAKWKIEYDKLPAGTPPSGYSKYDFYNAYSYIIGPGDEINEKINEYPVSVEIKNVWMPPESIIPAPDTALAENIISSNKLVVSGTTDRIGILVKDPENPSNNISISEYKIKIVYDRQTESLQSLKVKNIGIWLPRGFQYFTDSTQIDSSTGNPFVSTLEYGSLQLLYRSIPVPSTSSGNETVVWSYNSPFPSFTDFPSDVLTYENHAYSLEIKFYYRSLRNPNDKPDAIAWIKTNGDEEYQVSHIPFSWNADVRVFHIQSAAGNVVVDAYVPKNEMRETSTTIAGDYWVTGNTLMRDAIPDSAHIRDTWLQEDISIPGNSSFNEIPAESSGGLGDGIPTNAEVKKAYLYWTSWYETAKIPNGDGYSSGLWTTSPCWDDVDEIFPRDSDYMVGRTDTGGYKLFYFSPFSVPSGATISGLTVHVRARDESIGNNSIFASLMVDGDVFNSTLSYNPSSGWNTYSYSFSVNPKTELAWTVEDVNGTGEHPLQQFGVYSNDLNPDIRVSMVHIEIGLDSMADTSIYFKIDDKLVYLDQEDTDGDGVLVPTPREGILGTEQITADDSEIIISTQGLTYACRKDVTELVLEFAEPDDGEVDEDGLAFDDGNDDDDIYRPGIAKYTVGGVDGTLGDNNPGTTQLAHAGWALVIIYTSPNTYVNQIYLYDIANVGFTHAFDYSNLDFDGDGEPGGTIKGFIVPERIIVDKDRNGVPDDEDGDGEPEEENAAKMTVFVGEGDDIYDGDYIEFNSLPLSDGTGSDGGDTWNGLSTLFDADGVDIDTFYVTWASNLLQPGDTSAQVNMYTQDDNWNMVFIILSFRSVPTTGGTLAYFIH